jgi:membrane-bound lytic murein transglycosylase B
MMRIQSLSLAAFLLLAAEPATAETCGNTGDGFKQYIASVRKEAAAEGVSKNAIAALSRIKYDPSIIKKDRAQNVFSQDFLTFQARMASAGRISKGKQLIGQYQDVFQSVEQKYGVPAAVITAFWALETDFGGFMGNSPTIQSIATLAWDCRRPEKFRPQLIASLQLLDSGDMTFEEMKGAWAGEIGQTQFMAYDYNESAV